MFPLNKDKTPGLSGALSLHMCLRTASYGFTGRFLWPLCRSVISIQLLLEAVSPPVLTYNSLVWMQTLGQETFSRYISDHVN